MAKNKERVKETRKKKTSIEAISAIPRRRWIFNLPLPGKKSELSVLCRQAENPPELKKSPTSCKEIAKSTETILIKLSKQLDTCLGYAFQLKNPQRRLEIFFERGARGGNARRWPLSIVANDEVAGVSEPDMPEAGGRDVGC